MTAITLDVLAGSEFTGSMAKMPKCQILNDRNPKSIGLFIREATCSLIGWKGKAPTDEHCFSDGTIEKGALLQEFRAQFILTSPRFIENKGERSQILGSYESPDAAEMYRQMKEAGEKVTLRTLHLIQLVDEKNNPLHDVPLVLSIHGAAAAVLGKALGEFRQKLEMAFANAQKLPYSPKGERFHALGVFHCKFAIEQAGSGADKSPIAGAQLASTATDNTLELYLDLTTAQRTWDMQKAFAGFAKQFFGDIAAETGGVHTLAPGVDLEDSSIPTYTVNATGEDAI